MSKFLSGRHAALHAYTPGEQPVDMQYIKLNTNESPYPPSPGVIARLGSGQISALNLYPSPDGARIRSKLAEFYGVNAENVIIANGSDELLAFAFLAFCDDSRHAAFPDISYGFYPVYAALYGVPHVQIPLMDDFAINVPDYCGIGKNVILANPNAPTGLALPLRDVEAIVRSNPDHMVLIDEAYIDFGAESAVQLTKKYDNLLVLQTYSKFRSMAGARMAYAIGSAALIDDMNKMKFSFNPYNVNRLTQELAVAAIEEDGYYRANSAEIIRTREKTAAALRNMGFTMTASQANFLFAKHPGIPGADLLHELRTRGILVRHFDLPRIADYLRITIGTPGQMVTFAAAVRDIFEKRNLL